MFQNIETVIRDYYTITIEEERYGSALLIGMDYCWHPYNMLVADLIHRATSPGDMDAMKAFDILYKLSTTHSEFLFVRAKTLNDGLIELDKKAELWNKLGTDEKEFILNKLSKASLGK